MNSIQLVIERSADRDAVGDLLADRYDVVTDPELGDHDLYLVDEHAFPAYHESLQARVDESHPVFCPVVLVRRPESAVEVTLPDPAERERPQIVDETIAAPLTRKLVVRRIESLLARREQSLELRETVDELEATNQQLERYAEAVETSEDLIAAVSADDEFLFANSAYREYYDVDDVEGRPVRDVLGDDTFAQQVESAHTKAMAGEAVTDERTQVFPGLGQRTLSTRHTPMDDGSGVTGLVAVLRDITERKERERDLAFFEQAVGQVGTGVAAYDATGTISYVNDAYAEMLGTKPAEIEGSHVTSVNPAFDADQFDAYWDSFENGETRRRETFHRHFEDGTHFPVEATTTHVTIDDAAYHIGTVQDITERKARERDLQMFREAVEQAGHAVTVTDVDGTIEYVNPAFEDLTGYDRDAAIGNTPAMLQSGEHGREFYRDLWETILAGEVWTGEIINERRDGQRFVIDQTISPLTDDDGELAHFVAITRDVTELKEQRRELERQNQRLEKFGRTVAHDLRNPLTVIDNYLDVARAAEDPEVAHDKMAASVDRMTELIEELLALAEQGKTVLDPEPASLEAVATASWEHVDTRDMTLDVVDDASLLMDDSRVTQLLENLFRNAREHAGDAATVRVGTLADGFYVEDDGPGIPPGDRENVLKSGFTTTEAGTGFGLAIVSQIADAHNWRVTVTAGSDDVTTSEASGGSDEQRSFGGARFEFRGVSDEPPATQ